MITDFFLHKYLNYIFKTEGAWFNMKQTLLLSIHYLKVFRIPFHKEKWSGDNIYPLMID